MTDITRRNHLLGMFGMAAAAAAPLGARAAGKKADQPVPPQGIGRRIRHISYSDQGGRPDGVQVMVNRKHIYVARTTHGGCQDLRNHSKIQLHRGHQTKLLRNQSRRHQCSQEPVRKFSLMYIRRRCRIHTQTSFSPCHASS